MMDYITLIADIIKSKEIGQRNKFQLELKNELEKINRASGELISPYTITLGDEFQAVYQSGEHLLSDILMLLVKLYPIRIRFAVGWGEIITQIDKEKSIGMDGPAFYYAREGINDLKKMNYSIIQLYGKGFKEKELINKSLKLALSLMSEWKENTLIIFTELMREQPIKNIAQLLGITKRGVYKIINTNQLRNFKDFFYQMETEMKRIGSQ
jgi:hypothetical protein